MCGGDVVPMVGRRGVGRGEESGREWRGVGWREGREGEGGCVWTVAVVVA